MLSAAFYRTLCGYTASGRSYQPHAVRQLNLLKTSLQERSQWASRASSSYSHVPFWESGSGHYGNTLGKQNRQTALAAEPLIWQYLEPIPVTKNGVFTIGDYGSNDGYSFMPLLGNLIGRMRKKHGEHLALQVIFEDQEKNDFNSLFKRLSEDASFTSEFSNVYTFATNVNFYKQCVPDNTCDVIYSSTSAHWLENEDFKFRDTIVHLLATEEEDCHFRALAQQDWTKFLLLRAKELKSGGMLIVLNLSSADHYRAGVKQKSSSIEKKKSYGEPREDGTPTSDKGGDQMMNFTVDSLECALLEVYLDLDTAWRQLRDQNIITKKEYETCNFIHCIRKKKDLQSPFEAVNSAVRGAGLHLVYHDQVVQSCFFKNMWWQKLLKEGVDDRQYFANNLINAHRVWSNSTFEKSLSDDHSAEEKAAILNRFYETASGIVACKDPRTYKSDYLISRMIAVKN